MTTRNLFRAASAALVALLVVACTGGSDETGGGGLLGSSGVPQPGALTLTGPSVVAPGVDTTGFVATLKTGSAAVPNVTLTLSVTSGTINTFSSSGQELFNQTSAKTDSLGRVAFNYQAPDTVTKPTSVTITAAAGAGYVDNNGQPLKQTLVVVISPDTFKFVAPDPNTVVKVGSTNAVPLRFQWTQATADGTAGVDGSVNLTATSNAVIQVAGSSQNEAPNTTVNVKTDPTNDGDFAAAVQVFDNTRGFATITATNAANINQSATITLQFVDVPASSNLVANPLTIPPATTSDSISQLTYTVNNQANQPIAGIDVVFTLINPTNGNNERLFPLGGTTDDNGVVTSRYYAGDKTGTVTIQACVKDYNVCDSRQITISTSATTTPPATTGSVALAGLTNIGQHSIYTGYTATLTDSNGNPVAGTFLALSPSAGNIYAPPGTGNKDSGGATTDSNGQVGFDYLDDNPNSQAKQIVITGSANVGGKQVTKTLTVTVNPDPFTFTAPAANAQLKSGQVNAQQLGFSWMHLDSSGNLQPRLNPVQLSITGSAKIVSPGNADANSVTISTDGSGHFPSTVQIYDTVNESVTVTAQDTYGWSYTSTLPVQFVAP